MNTERRNSIPAVPEEIDRYLNDVQIASLDSIAHLDCALKFVRRPNSDNILPVLHGPDGETLGIIEKNGRIVWDPEIPVRDE